MILITIKSPTVKSKFSITAPLIPLFVVSLLIVGCGTSGSEAKDETGIDVVATTTQIADLVRNIGGESVGVAQILQPNSDPHGFEPRPDDVAATAAAALVFANGEDLDPWAEKLVAESGSEAPLIDLSTGLPDPLADSDTHGESEEDHHGEEGHAHDSELDPHWWHDPRNAIAASEEIAAQLSELDPDNARAYERNLTAYRAKLERLDGQIETCIDRIPQKDRKLVTDHEAFGYFAHRYGLELIGTVIPALTSQAQPSARDLKELAEAIEHEGVSAIFPETSLSPKLATAIAAQTGTSVAGTLYGDSLGPEGSDGDTYLKMEAANATAIAAGLSGGRLDCEFETG